MRSPKPAETPQTRKLSTTNFRSTSSTSQYSASLLKSAARRTSRESRRTRGRTQTTPYTTRGPWRPVRRQKSTSPCILSKSPTIRSLCTAGTQSPPCQTSLRSDLSTSQGSAIRDNSQRSVTMVRWGHRRAFLKKLAGAVATRIQQSRGANKASAIFSRQKEPCSDYQGLSVSI